MTDQLLDLLNDIKLSEGIHETRESGMCAMEAAAYIMGLPHSETPACVAPNLAMAFGDLNDVADDEQRQRLKYLLPRAIGTGFTNPTLADCRVECRRGEAYSDLLEYIRVEAESFDFDEAYRLLVAVIEAGEDSSPADDSTRRSLPPAQQQTSATRRKAPACPTSSSTRGPGSGPESDPPGVSRTANAPR